MNFARFFAVDSNVTNISNFENRFSSQQDDKMLEILNKSSPEQLSKYNIPLAHIQNISNWKSKKGPFKSLNEVLEIEGFGECILKEFGESVVQNNTTEVKHKKFKNNKQRRNIIMPEININLLSSLKSAVAIHLDPMGVGWVKLGKENNTLISWTCENFSSLPEKMMPVDTFNLAINILKKTPTGDVYVLETINSLGPQAQTKQAAVTTYNQKIELSCMLLALLNTSVTHNLSLQKLGTQETFRIIENRVFSLRSNIPARLFGTFIGSEKVSAVTAVNGLLKGNSESHSSLPYTPVIFGNNLETIFYNQSSVKKESLAQALMLGVSFMDLCVRRRKLSYEALNHKKNKKK